MKKEKGKRNSEKVMTSILFTFSLLLFTCDAAVPLSWTVETSRAQPATFEAYQGETLTFEASLQSHGKPLDAPLNYSFYWQTNGMGSTYWEAPCTPPIRRFDDSHDSTISNVLFATFTPSMDVGAKVYNCFIGSPSNIYHAAFQLRLRPSPGATPNALPLPTPVIDFAKVRVLNPPWSGSARLLPEYLHLLDFDDSYPADAAWYYSQPQDYGSCSAVRDGNTLSRNYDWKFDEAAEFIVRMSAGPGRFASVGVANCGTNLTEQAVTSGKPSRYYKCLPGRTVDGINEHGIAAEINVVDGAPAWHTTGDIHPLAAVRWVLDHATNAQHAASNLAARVKFPAGWTQNFHYMIADEASTYIVENGAFSNVTGRAVMTNFPLYPEPAFGSGWERYNLLMDGENITNAWFTQCYNRSTNPPWLSEFDNNYEHWIAALNAWERLGTMDARRRTGAFWQTVHTSVYDLPSRVLRVAVQETDDWYTFAVPLAGGVKVETDPTVPAWAKEANPPAVDAYTKEQTDTKLADKADAAEVPQMARNAMSAEGISSSGINIGGNISGATVSDQHGNLRTAIGSKVSQSDYDSEISSIWSSIGNKVDSSNGSASDLTVSDSMTIPSMDSVYTYGYDPSWGSWRDMTLDEAISGACSSYCSGYLYDGSSLGWTGLYFYDTAKIYLYDGWSAIVSGLTDTTLADVISEIDSTLRDHAGDYDNPHQVSPEQIGAITPSYISTNNPAFVSEVLATGMQLDPTAVAEFNEACRRGSLESNVVFHVRRYFQDTTASHYYWDPILQRTWQISVSNGCFFSAIVDNIVR